MGDVQDDSSPATMRATRPIPVELCKPTRAVPPLPPTASCQHKTGKLQASKLQRERERKPRLAGWRAGRAGHDRDGQAQKSRRGSILERASSEQQGEGVVQGWHVSPLRPRDLDADPPGGSPQCGLLNERATVGDLMDPEMVVVIKISAPCRGARHTCGHLRTIIVYLRWSTQTATCLPPPPSWR